MKPGRRHTNRVLGCRGVTVIEVLVAAGILAVSFGIFYNVFVVHWTALEGTITRDQLWQEASTILRRMSDDGRQANIIVIAANTATRKAVEFKDQNDVRIALYDLLPNGDMQRTDTAGNTELLSDNVLFGNSDFQKNSHALEVELSLAAPVLTRTVRVDTANEIFPRNYLY